MLGNHHLNLFDFYEQKESLPIENNITRGLAISFQESPLLLERFFDYVNEECTEKMPKDDHTYYLAKLEKPGDFTIEIQSSINSIVKNIQGPLSNIIGITITTKSPKGSFSLTQDNIENPIPDIVITNLDTLILIEVKCTETDAREQLRNQINALKSQVDAPEPVCINCEWAKIITFIQSAISLQGYPENRILSDYLAHLENRYPQWFPVSLLTDSIPKSRQEIVLKKRVEKLTQNCCKLTTNSKGRTMIPLDKTWCSEVQVNPYLNPKTDEYGIQLDFWSGNQKSQSEALFQLPNITDTFKETALSVGKETLSLLSKPYLKLYDSFGKEIINIDASKEYCIRKFTNASDYQHLISNLCGRWVKEVSSDGTNNSKQSWTALLNLVMEEYKELLDIDIFKKAFNEQITSSSRTQFNLTFGYVTSIYIPSKSAKKHELHYPENLETDSLAQFVNQVIHSWVARMNTGV